MKKNFQLCFKNNYNQTIILKIVINIILANKFDKKIKIIAKYKIISTIKKDIIQITTLKKSQKISINYNNFYIINYNES